jgi:hypothetical protein
MNLSQLRLCVMLRCVAIVSCCSFALAPTGFSQNSTEDVGILSNLTIDRSVFGGGSFYYAILNEASNQVVARGIMDVEGISSIILAPETTYRILSFYAETLSFGFKVFTTPTSGRTFRIPAIEYFLLEDVPDVDADGLSDPLEFVAGTNAYNKDTDGDGFFDGAEVTQGKNPLDGFVVQTGIIASGPTPGSAVDICAINNVVLMACGAQGVSIFNVRAGSAPTRVGVVDTPGQASAVTCYGSLIAVADGTEGLAIIDAADPPAARIIHQLRFGSPVQAVTARGHYVFAGLANGVIIMIDMFSGTESGRYVGGLGAIEDLGERRGLLYALVSGSLYTLRPNDGDFELLHRAEAPGSRGAGGYRLRLFMGDEFILTTHTSGINRYSLTKPTAPAHLGNFTNGQFGWKQIVGNGGGLGIAAVSANSTQDGIHHIDLYNMGGNNTSPAYARTFPTPGIATAVALYNGLAYVADGVAGLQVINYLSFDVGSEPPVATLFVDQVDGQVEEGKVISVRVTATDDVQVRNVEFFIDEQAVALDGNFPFELGLIAPSRTGFKSDFTIHAVVTDTGGNRTVTPTQTVNLVTDATPPRVRTFKPAGGSIVGQLSAALAVFSEPLDESSLTNSSITMREAGPDGIFLSGDDVTPPNFSWEYQSLSNSLVLSFTDGAAAGLYRVDLSAPLADLAGNVIAAPYTATFQIYGFADSDQDGVPDDLEPLLELDPANPDTNNNNIADGLEDFDGDGLPNVGEVLLSTNPRQKDTDNNGISDGQEDADLDGLENGQEIRSGTSPVLVDSDHDGVSDSTELAEFTDPLNAKSRPLRRLHSNVVSFLNADSKTLESNETRQTILSPVYSYANNFTSYAQAGETRQTILSPVYSYANNFTSYAQAGETRQTILSPVYSYANNFSSSAPAGETRQLILSLIYSYKNTAP